MDKPITEEELENEGLLTASQKSKDYPMPLTKMAVEKIVSQFNFMTTNTNIVVKQPNFDFETYVFDMNTLYAELIDKPSNQLSIMIVLFDSRIQLKDAGKYHFFTLAKCGDSYYIFDTEGLGSIFQEATAKLKTDKVFGIEEKLQRDYFNCGSFSCGLAESLIKKFKSLGSDSTSFNSYMQKFFCGNKKYGITYELKIDNISILPVELAKYNQSFTYLEKLIEKQQNFGNRFQQITTAMSEIVGLRMEILGSLTLEEVETLSLESNRSIIEKLTAKEKQVFEKRKLVLLEQIKAPETKESSEVTERLNFLVQFNEGYEKFAIELKRTKDLGTELGSSIKTIQDIVERQQNEADKLNKYISKLTIKEKAAIQEVNIARTTHLNVLKKVVHATRELSTQTISATSLVGDKRGSLDHD